MANSALKFSAWKETEASNLEEKELVPFQPIYPSKTWLLSLHNMASNKNKIYEMQLKTSGWSTNPTCSCAMRILSVYILFKSFINILKYTIKSFNSKILQ